MSLVIELVNNLFFWQHSWNSAGLKKFEFVYWKCESWNKCFEIQSENPIIHVERRVWWDLDFQETFQMQNHLKRREFFFFFWQAVFECNFVTVQCSEKHNYITENSRDLCSLIQDQRVWLNFQHWATPVPDGSMHKHCWISHHDFLARIGGGILLRP